ncbi:hypothetical protein Riv7116_3450 [Rivularia sp. PCC 7116]|uniref:hypothetical protein n=1 Tax=Rivularia sp. PCC 7116 TaxID=373994 RepID=UPI00029F32E4|nr:hypothetical protein [Rivularia sp. PCC 7116]AFY55905.1 hypothetical protein Riv7116_3450 [Rivularia sp. PCC 7116]
MVQEVSLKKLWRLLKVSQYAKQKVIEHLPNVFIIFFAGFFLTLKTALSLIAMQNFALNSNDAIC